MTSSFPFARYKEAWVDFRAITNETIVTAKHLVHKTDITTNQSILDIGCGDGTLFRGILQSGRHSFKKGIFVEVEKELIERAKINLQYAPFSPACVFIHKNLTQLDFSEYRHVDAILASHVFYLVKEDFCRNFLKSIRPGTKLYIILDEPYSVFDSFWVHTASFFHERLRLIHEILSNLPIKNYITKKTSIRCKMKNPLLLPDSMKLNVLSLLCYSDASLIFDSDPAFFFSTIQKFQEGNFLTYHSFCYEIERKV